MQYNVEVKVFNKGNQILPQYESPNSAGFDFKACFKEKQSEDDFLGNDGYEYDNKNKELTLFAEGGRVLIPTGLHIALPEGYELQVRPRSGLALKKGISVVNSPGTIDCYSESSKITTTNGEKLTNELHIGDSILSFNEDNGKIEKDIIVCIKDTGIQEVYKIETENGILEVTPNTLIYTTNGIKKAYDLDENDEIIIE